MFPQSSIHFCVGKSLQTSVKLRGKQGLWILHIFSIQDIDCGNMFMIALICLLVCLLFKCSKYMLLNLETCSKIGSALWIFWPLRGAWHKHFSLSGILKRTREEKGVGEGHEEMSLKCDKELSKRMNKVFLNSPFCQRLSVSHLLMCNSLQV